MRQAIDELFAAKAMNGQPSARTATSSAA